MFLLMSSWADTYSDRKESIPCRMGKTFRSAGIGITITSLTDLLAFAIGASSVFISVRNFCIYTALHGYRIYEKRHCLTCLKRETREYLENAGDSKCKVWCCGGSAPTQRGQDERCVETIPRKYLPMILLNACGYAFVQVVLIVYLLVSFWGIMNLKQGLVLKDLVSPASYYHTYAETDDKYFKRIFPVPFVFGSGTDYIQADTVHRFESILERARADAEVNSDSLLYWFHSYRATRLYDNSTLAKFITGLQAFIDDVPLFQNDVIFDSSNSTITASRCYLFSTNIKDSKKQADLMLRMRSLADSSPLSVYVFHPAFIYFEQYVAILPSTLQTVGITLAVMTVVTFIFLPHPLLVLLVVLNIVSILVGIFGFLHVWGLSLNSVTMIHLIMSVGFSVDFSVHVCSAYMLGEGETRKDKVEAAITHAAGPILNGALSSFLGIVVLVFSKSYIFNSFFKIMLLVILFGALHAVLFLPVILWLCGPLSHSRVSQSPQNSELVSAGASSSEEKTDTQTSNGTSNGTCSSVSDGQVQPEEKNSPKKEVTTHELDTRTAAGTDSSVSKEQAKQQEENGPKKGATTNGSDTQTSNVTSSTVSNGQAEQKKVNDQKKGAVTDGSDTHTSTGTGSSVSYGQAEQEKETE